MRTLRHALSSCLFLSLFLPNAHTQDNAIRVYAGKEFIGDHINADASVGVAYRHGLNNWLYAESFLRVNYGGLLLGDRNPPRGGNYIGGIRDFAFEDEVEYDPMEKGIHSNGNFDSHLLTVIHGYQLGFQTGPSRKFKLYTGLGISIGYMDLQEITEEGDALVTIDGEETLIWYAIPVYQRGMGLQWSTSMGIEKNWKSGWFCGLRADLDAGGLNAGALGTRMSICLAVGKSL
jgi:hypothetical protein